MKQNYLKILFSIFLFTLSQNIIFSQCEIWDVIAEAHDCDDDGNFLVDIEFNSNNTGNNGFSIVGNGNNYGSFLYGQTFYTVGPIQGNGQELEFVIIDNQFEDCSDFTVLEAPDCGNNNDCEIWDLTFETGECNNDGSYNLVIDFNYANANNEFFDVIYDGENIGFFLLENLPIVIDNFEDNGEPIPAITVCINDTPDCCTENEFEAPDCGGGNDCEIWDVFAEAHDCDDEGNFLVDIEFNSNNMGNEGFSIVGNGMDYGDFDYGQTFYTVGPIDGNGQNLEFIIIDNQFGDCSGFTGLDAPFCGGSGDCEIGEVNVQTSLCNDEGQYDVVIDFEVANTTNAFFDLFVQGDFFGFFALADLPLTLENFESDLPFPSMSICINDNPNCCTEFEFEAPDCGNGNDCEIWDLEFVVGECDDNGNYDLTINFNYDNVDNEFFDVIYDGEILGFFLLEDLPITIENFEGNGEAFPAITVCINDNPDCCTENEFEAPDCGSELCQIFDVITEAHDCDDNGQFLVDIAFVYLNNGDGGFSVYAGDNFLGNFDYGETFYTVGPINSMGGEPIIFTIIDNEIDGCQGSVALEGVDCGSENFVWPGDANSDNIADNFDVLNLGLVFEMEGFDRDAQTIDWAGYLGDNWDGQFENEVNHKHADCDGNGAIGWSDLTAINENYELTHGFVEEFVPIEGTEDDPVFLVDLPAAEPIIAGEPFSAPIILGDDQIGIENLYGIAFTIKFDTDIIDPSSVEISFDENWMGTNEVNIMSFQKNWSEMGEIDVAITKIDQNNVSGFGQIAAFIGVIDDLVGKELMEIEITDVKAINQIEMLIPLRTPITTGEIISSDTNLSPNNQVNIFPNPTTHILNINNDFGLPIDNLIIKNVDGKVISNLQNIDNQIDITNLSNGIYLLEMKIGERRFYEKLVKM